MSTWRSSRLGDCAKEAGDALQVLCQTPRRTSDGLADIDLPVTVDDIGQVKLYTGKLAVRFFLQPEVEPFACDEQPVVAVHVEALLSVPSAGARRRPVLSW